MRITNSHSKQKIKLLIGAGLIIAGAGTSVFLATSYLKNKQFQSYDLGKFSWNANTKSQDVIDAINNNKKLISYKNESIEFLKSKIYTYDLYVLCMSNEEASSDAYAQAQAYEKEFYEIVSKYYDLKLTSKFPPLGCFLYYIAKTNVFSAL